MSLTRKKFLSDEELQSTLELLEKYKDDRDSILIRLMLYTGARPCETLNIKPEDVYQDTITVYGAKGSNNRSVPIPAEFVQELLDYIKANNIKAEEKIFPITTRHFRRIWDKWRPARKPKLHGLRHTLGVRLYDNSRNIHAVKTFLGHRNIKNTMIYLDFVEGADQLRNESQGMWRKKSA